MIRIHKDAETQKEMWRVINHKAVGGKSRRGEELTLTVFAMHVFVGAGWGGNEGVWSRTVCLSLTVSQGNYTPAT